MSRYVTVAIELGSLEEVRAALGALGLEHERAAVDGERVMLDGTLECAGEPVDLRVQPGPYDTIEDFGFTLQGEGVALVCGDVDRRRLERVMVPALRAAVVEARARTHAAQHGLDVRVEQERDGTRRLVLKRR